jgi:hypothetical protein
MKKPLNEIVSKKINTLKRDIIQENRIVRKELLLIEKYNNRLNKSKKYKVDDLITEMFYLNRLGIKGSVINENILDFFKNILGMGENTAVEPVAETFKERFIDYIIKIVIPGASGGLMANMISTGLANIDVNNIDQLTDCETLSDLISKSIVEGIIKKLNNNAGLVGGIFDTVRKGLVDAVENMAFAENIKNGISSFICDDISDKIDELKNKIKDLRD